MPFDTPTSARRESSTYEAIPYGSAFAIKRTTTWKNLDGDWDGDFDVILSGLSEGTARLVCDEKNGVASVARAA
jgi:hypothetical protein